jgi:hypothetical protein
MHKRAIVIGVLSAAFFLNIKLNSAVAAGITIGPGATMTLSRTPEITTVDLTIDGTLTADRGTVNFSGTWARTGTFNANAGTVSIVGSGTATITGSNTFNKLSCTTSSKSIVFTADTTQIIGSTFTLTGASGARITLRSSVSAAQWKIDPQGQISVSFVDVQDSNNLNTTVITPSNSLDSGNNQGWKFGSLSISPDQSLIAGAESAEFTVDLQFSNSNTANRDIIINLDSDSSGAFEFRAVSGGTAVTSVTIPAGSTSTTFFYVDNAESSPSTTLSASSLGYTSGTLNITVAIVTYSVTVTSPQVAGSDFRLVVTANKQGGGTFTDYSGTASLTVNYISPDTGSGTLGITSTSAFVNGRATLNNETFSDCGTITITATDIDRPAVTGTSSNIDFRPFDFKLAATELDAAGAVNTVASHAVNKEFKLTVTARNAQSATCPNYKGNANLTINYISPSTDQSGSLLKTLLASSDWSAGVSSFIQVYDRWGKITITATDATLTTQTGVSESIFFIPNDFLITLSDPPRSRTFYYINEDFSATVTARDFNNSTVANYGGEISFFGTGLNLPADYTFTADDSGSHKFEGINGPAEISTGFSVKDTSFAAAKGASPALKLKAGTIKVIDTSGPVGELSVPVKIFDSAGNLITEDDSTVFIVSIDEFIEDNASAVSTVTDSAATVSGGATAIAVSDTQPETVFIIPSSTPVLAAVTGRVRFGTVSGSGVGIGLWREIQEPLKFEEKEQ